MTGESARVQWSGAGGLSLIGDGFGDPGAAPVLLLHGGGQTRHAWGGTGRALATAGFYAVALDMRGHGESGWAPDGDYELDAFAADLLAILPRFSRPPAVVGASLGGLAALVAEGDRGEHVLSALVLVDVAPRLEIDGVLRVVSFMKSNTDGFASLEDAADAIASYLPHRPRPTDLSGLSKNLRLGDDGRYRWHWDPRFIQRERVADPAMALARLQGAARQLSIPTLLVRGRLSDVLSAEAAREFLDLVPHAEFVDVASAAHMVAGDHNDLFCDAIVDFLRRVRRA